MKTITELLKPESQATVDDRHQYAQGFYKNSSFESESSLTANDIMDQLSEKIANSLPIKDLSFLQLQDLIHAVDNVVKEKANLGDEEEYWILCWSGTTYTIIQEELTRRLAQFAAQSSSSGDISRATARVTINYTNSLRPALYARDPEILLNSWILRTSRRT